MKRGDVVNLTGGITTDDGRSLFGMDAEHYMKVKRVSHFYSLIR